MKTKRAYYDDPVMALLATKHGIRLYNGKDISVLLTQDDLASRLYSHNARDITEKYYIHPDDMHMLEPRKEDVVELSGLKGVWPTFATVTNFSFPIESTNISVGLNSWCAPAKLEDLKIIIRNNLPFPWPKFEGD